MILYSCKVNCTTSAYYTKVSLNSCILVFWMNTILTMAFIPISANIFPQHSSQNTVHWLFHWFILYNCGMLRFSKYFLWAKKNTKKKTYRTCKYENNLIPIILLYELLKTELYTPRICMLKPLLPVPQTVALFGDKTFKELSKLT